MSFEVREGDCITAMRAMPACSVDSVVCDPPYGLEFMGKDWDSFKTGRGEAYAAGGQLITAEQIEERRGKGGAGPSYVNRPAKRCAKCGKQAWSGSPCQCEQPEWELDNSPLHAAQEWHQAWATEALRVLKPGGHLLAFGGTRTYHRLVCAVEDAGFEIRDTISWMYGSGFPKSLDVSKAIDRAAGAERETVGRKPVGWGGLHANERLNDDGWSKIGAEYPEGQPITAPATPEAERWEGWGTALKPSHEPVVVARKPLSGTVAATVLEHGTGALNVDGCRVGTGEDRANGGPRPNRQGDPNWRMSADGERPGGGRWPANVVLSHTENCRWLEPENYGDEERYPDGPGWECHPDCPVRLLDEQTGELGGGTFTSGSKRLPRIAREQYGDMQQDHSGIDNYGDQGGASRFFYVAKASRGERNAGLEGFEERQPVYNGQSEGPAGCAPGSVEAKFSTQPRSNVHPTVKPISLMRWLVRLVTPPDGTVLDPFTGSGSTGCAAVLEGFDFIGLEREAEYVEIARARIAWWYKHRGDGQAAEILAAGEARDAVEATGQSSLFD